MTLKNNRAPLLSNIKLYVSFHHHMWFQTGVTVRKRLSWVVTSVTLTFDLWPWTFAWTLPWSVVITPENFMMIRWWEHSPKGVTDGQTDGQTENTIHRAAGSQLKTPFPIVPCLAQWPAFHSYESWVNPWTQGTAWLHTQHYGYWCPGAKAPSHQYPECWSKIHYIEAFPHKGITCIVKGKWPSCLRVECLLPNIILIVSVITGSAANPVQD